MTICFLGFREKENDNMTFSDLSAEMNIARCQTIVPSNVWNKKNDNTTLLNGSKIFSLDNGKNKMTISTEEKK
jgi:hypothetical protein